MNAERGSLGLKVDARKEMCLELTLVEEGRPEAAIAVGDDPVICGGEGALSAMRL
jgi:hypothetical protein